MSPLWAQETVSFLLLLFFRHDFFLSELVETVTGPSSAFLLFEDDDTDEHGNPSIGSGGGGGGGVSFSLFLFLFLLYINANDGILLIMFFFGEMS